MEKDINYRLIRLLRGRTSEALRRNSKAGHTRELLGCSIQELKLYLESKFQPGMTWENHGTFGWHIDHVKPCASFDLSDAREQEKCFHYTNMQPLWAKENLSKGSKITSTPFLSETFPELL